MRWARPAGRYLMQGVVWIGIPLGLAQALASPVLIFGLFGFDAPHKVPPQMFVWAWTYYVWNYQNDPGVRQWALYSGAPAAAIVGGIALWLAFLTIRSRRQRLVSQGNPLALVPEPIRARSNIYGRARWLEITEASRLYRKPDPVLGGIPIVELNRVDRDRSIVGRTFDPEDKTTWGKGGTARLVIDPMRPKKIANGVIIGGSGIGKTAGFTISALDSYCGSMVINDPSGDASHITSARREEMHHKVAIIDPDFPALGAMNILKTIDIESNMAPVLIKAFVTEASGPSKADMTKEESFFKTKGIALNTALLADMLYDPSAEKTVREWRRRIVTPEREMKDRLRVIYGHTKSSYARDIVGEMMDTYHETASGIRSHATGDTEWLSLEPLATLLSEDTFDPAELIRGKMTVFMQFSAAMLEADPSVARVVLGSLMRSVMKAKGRVACNVPFIIDEAYQLKHMQTIAVARDMGRHFRMPLYTMWQSEGQIEEVWKATGKKAFFNSAAWRMYLGGVDDPVTAKELSDVCGSYTALVPSEGSNSSMPAGIAAPGRMTRGTNQGLTLQPRKLITPDELRTNIRLDEAVVLFRGQHPARLGIPLWFRRKDMLAHLKPNPFLTAAPPTGVAVP